MHFNKKKIVIISGFLGAILILWISLPQSNTVSIYEIQNEDFPVEYIGESFRKNLELEIEQYNELKYDESQKTVIVFPTFTGIAYQENGFYDYYKGNCDESCITLEIPEETLFTHIGFNAFFLLTYLDYPSITDIELDQNPQILQDYDKVILLHNEYVTKNEFNAIINHPKVVYLFPNALYAEIMYDKKNNSFTLIRGHNYPEHEIVNGFDWMYDNTHPYEFDQICSDWNFYEIPNGIMLNCYPQNTILNNLDMVKKIKEY